MPVIMAVPVTTTVITLQACKEVKAMGDEMSEHKRQGGYTLTLLALVLAVISLVLVQVLPDLIVKRTRTTLDVRDQMAAIEISNQFASYLEEAFTMGHNFKPPPLDVAAALLCQESHKTLVTLTDPNTESDDLLYRNLRFCFHLVDSKFLKIPHPMNPQHLVVLNVTDPAVFFVPKKKANAAQHHRRWPAILSSLLPTAFALSPPQIPNYALTLTPKLPFTAEALAAGNFRPLRAQDQTLAQFYQSDRDLKCFETASCVVVRFCASAFHSCDAGTGWFEQTIVIPRPGGFSI